VKALVFQARETLMGWRAARETPCAQVREQLATLRGSALRRASIRRHVEQCAGCAEYETEVNRQRAALCVALPVVPAAGLKAAVLSSVLGGSGAAIGAGAATTGVAGVGAKGLVAKLLAVATIAGGAGTGGYVAVEQLQKEHGRPHARTEPAAAAVRATPVALDTPAPAIKTEIAAPTGAAAEPTSPAAKPKAKRARGRALGKKAAHGKAAAPGQLKAPGTPAKGKALGHVKQKRKAPKVERPAVKLKPKRATAKQRPKSAPASRGHGQSKPGHGRK
jgi:hypothetical protein